MEIKEATPADLPVMVRAGRLLHEETDYGKFLLYDEILVQENVLKIIQNEYGFCCLLWDGNILSGLILGHLSPNFYDPRQLKGICDAIGIMPKYRKTHWASKMLNMFEEWATEKGASLFFCGGYSKQFDGMVKRRGYQKIETSYVKKTERVSKDINTGGE